MSGSNFRKGSDVRRTKHPRNDEHVAPDTHVRGGQTRASAPTCRTLSLLPSVRIRVIRGRFLRSDYTDLRGPKQIHQGEMTMKTWRLTLLLGMLFTTFNLLAQSTPQKSFDVMKSLSGNWEGKTTMSDPVRVSYRLTSGGSALMSEIQTEMKGQSEDMIDRKSTRLNSSHT